FVFRAGPPGLEGAGRALQHLLDLRVGRGGELALGLVGGRVDDLVLAHADFPSASAARPVTHDNPGTAGSSGWAMTAAADRVLPAVVPGRGRLPDVSAEALRE